MNTKTSPSFGLPQSALDKLYGIFSNYTLINRVILYGSRAMGNYRHSSDIDLCIDAEQLSLTDLLTIENQIDDLLLPWSVDLSLMHHIDNPNLLLHIHNEGVEFYPMTQTLIKGA